MKECNPSPALDKRCRCRRRHEDEEEVDDGGDPVSCSGKKCQACTAGVIADCVAVCCCPCAVVNIITLAFFKLPWAVARRLVWGRRKKRRRQRMLEAKRRCGDGDAAAKGTTTSEMVLSSIVGVGVGVGEEELNYDFSAVFREEDVWLELCEVGHLGFGRVSFTGNAGSQ